jgi:hypothetical protein
MIQVRKAIIHNHKQRKSILYNFIAPNNRLSSRMPPKKKRMVQKWVEDSFEVSLRVPSTTPAGAWCDVNPSDYAPMPGDFQPTFFRADALPGAALAPVLRY